MRNLFLSMAAVAMLASCSSEEIIDKAPAQKSAIGFSTFVDKSTRATDITKDNISNFMVWGYMGGSGGVVFDGTTVTKQSNDEWESAEEAFWSAGKKYDFSAIAPATTDGGASFDYTVDQTSASKGTITFKNGNGTTDLLYAYNGDKQTGETITSDDPGEVGLTFKHLLSRVKFKFTNGIQNENSTLVITGVTITNAVTDATIAVDGEFDSETWTKTDDATGGLTFGNVDVKGNTSGTANRETDHYYMIPAPSSTPYTVTFKVQWKQGNENMTANAYTHTVTLPEVGMTSGNSYVFSATLDATNINPDEDEDNPTFHPITFTVDEVGGWDGDDSYENKPILSLQ